MKTTLESGAWIEHTPIQDLKGAHRRKIDRVGRPRVAAGAIDDSGHIDAGALVAGVDIMAFMAARHDALWALLITGWSYDLPLPSLEEAADGLAVSGAESYDEIPLDDYDEIEKILAPFGEKLARRPDPKNSTTSASNGSSPARAGGSRRG